MIDKQSNTAIKKLWRLALFIGFGILASLALSAALLPLFYQHNLAAFFVELHSSEAPWLPSASRMLAAIQQVCTFLVPGVIFYYLYGRGETKIRYTQKLFLYAIALNILSIPIVEIAFYVNQFVPQEWMVDDYGSNQLFIAQILNGNGLATQCINVLILCILPALGEELVFRFGLQKHILSNSSLGPTGAIILTSLVFSFIHFDTQGFLPRFILSLIIGASYHLSRTLLVPVLFHLFNNYMAYLQMKFNAEDSQLPAYFYNHSFITVTVVIVSVLLIMWVFNHMNKTTNKNLLSRENHLDTE